MSSSDTLPWITWDKDLAQLEPARWIARNVDRTNIALRTSHFASQLTASEAGLGLLLLPSPYLRVRDLIVAPITSSLSSSVASLPNGELWLVGHRAHRDVPRIVAVWEFLAESLRASMG